jgi:two-component system sensor histidine kinase AlgZ
VHPIFARPLRLLPYLGAWVPVGFVLAGLLESGVSLASGPALVFVLPLTLLYGLFCLSAWWVCRARPLTSDTWAPVVVAQLRAAVQTSAVWVAVAVVWGAVLSRVFHYPIAWREFASSLFVLLAAGMPLYLLSSVVHYLLLALEASHEATERVLESQVAARESELRAVRAQLNPHFLFNSLNSINALVGSDPEGARRMCEGLGDFLRRTLALGARARVTLGEELALVDRYLAIEQVRFGDRLAVERAIEPDALACALPPLLLQPLVENAIKHGVAGRIEGGTLVIAAARRGERLVVRLENPVDDDVAVNKGEGLGLDIVRRRLLVLGEEDASLVVTREPGSYRVTLDLPALAVLHD